MSLVDKRAVKKAIKSLVPPLVWNLATKVMTPWTGWEGDYRSWTEALQQCETGGTAAGYNTDEIAAKTVLRTKVLAENPPATDVRPKDLELLGVFQRMFGAMGVAELPNRPLNVLDFGGAMGSHYFALRPLIKNLAMHWEVVDLPKTIETAKREFAAFSELTFIEKTEARSVRVPDLVLASGSIQYCENPHQIFEEIASTGAQFILFDRMPMLSGDRDRLTVQTVPPDYYSAKYPAWFLSEQRFLNKAKSLGLDLKLRWTWHEGVVLDGAPLEDRGYLFQNLL